MPSQARPPDSTSSVLTSFASIPGRRYVTAVTQASSSTCEVRAARNPSVVYASSISCSGGPSIPIWNRWSITLTRANPCSSAVTAIRVRSSAQAGRSARVREVRDVQSDLHCCSVPSGITAP